jgi:ribosomal-protein-alanine N-acetyltransferase
VSEHQGREQKQRMSERVTPVLATSRLVLEPYTAGRVTDQHVAWLNDAEVVRYSEQRHKKHTLETQHRFLNEFPLDSHIWLISLRERDTISIGTITAYIDRHNRVADMGILIGEKSLWGRGYGAEAWDVVIDGLFSACDIRKIECGCMATNAPMIALAKHSGMKREGHRVCHFLLENGWTDLVIFGLLWHNMYQQWNVEIAHVRHA